MYTPYKNMLISPGTTVGTAVGTDLDFVNDNIKISLLTSAYTFSATHSLVTQLTGIVATSNNLTGKAVSSGSATVSSVAIGSVSGTISSLCLWKDTGTSSTSPLLAFFDTASPGAFPVVSSGGTVNVTFSSNTVFSI